MLNNNGRLEEIKELEELSKQKSGQLKMDELKGEEFNDDFEDVGDEEKENKVNSSFGTFNSKNSLQSKSNHEQGVSKQQPKPRIASGNRIRPGERLQSAKST